VKDVLSNLLPQLRWYRLRICIQVIERYVDGKGNLSTIVHMLYRSVGIKGTAAKRLFDDKVMLGLCAFFPSLMFKYLETEKLSYQQAEENARA
jgi:hypothetical protein